jgi:SpoVK/Ycf46/Vps4 family AAA+-type ATPase
LFIAYNDAKRMESQCTVLFFDEIDALGHSRGPSDSGGGQSSENDGCSRRVLAELLIQLTKLSSTANDKENDRYASNSSLSGCVLGEHNEKYMAESDDSSLHRENVRVIVVAATNRPEDCDPALLRRFSIRANVDLPAKRDRRKIISKFLCEFDHTITKAQLNDLAGATDGWSGCDLESLTREAAMAPIRECLRSAAMLKRRARKLEQQQQGGDESAQGVKQKPLDADEQARAALMKDFRQLRPVTLADFEDAVEFWLGHQHQGTSSPLSGSMQPKRKQVHYDSESSSEDEQD